MRSAITKDMAIQIEEYFISRNLIVIVIEIVMATNSRLTIRDSFADSLSETFLDSMSSRIH